MAVLIIVLVMVVFPIISIVCIVYEGKLKKYSPTKIILKALGGLIFFLSLYAIGGYFFFAGFSSTGRLNKHLDKIFEEEYSSIVFEGNIHNIFYVRQNGRRRGFLCVDIMKTNTTNFYRYDENTGLIIKNNKAIFPIGIDIVQEHLNKYSYVKVNDNHNKLIVFSNDEGESDTLSLNYYHGGIDESNMSICKCYNSN